jgi:hypothetical protein
MSIRPVDYTSLIPKTQELSKTKQVELDSLKNQMDIQMTQQEKQINKNMKSVRDTNKTENLIIDTKKEREKQKKGRKKKKNENGDKEKEKTKEVLGGNIDIRI